MFPFTKPLFVMPSGKILSKSTKAAILALALQDVKNRPMTILEIAQGAGYIRQVLFEFSTRSIASPGLRRRK